VISLILAILYPIAIQYERETWPTWVQRLTGWKVFPMVLRIPFGVIAFFAWFIDVAANYTELSIAMWELPRWKEWTFSTRLSRLIREHGWRSDVARFVARILDYIAPSGKHIQ
jgi:hypothetical protein